MTDEVRAGGSRTLEIRKYPNRRYYDATRSRHVTLEEIHTLVREGYDIEVTDSKTGEPLTGRVLAQIILELDTPKLAVFPADLLHQVIRANQQVISDFVQKHFSQALSAFLQSQRHFETYLRQAMGLGDPSSATQTWPGAMAPFFKPWWATQTHAPQTGPEVQNTRALRTEVTELREQLEALRKELEQARKTKA